MIPVNEGNEECHKCKHFDLSYGCVPTYADGNILGKLPPCERDVILSQKHLKELLKKAQRKEKQHIFEHLRRIFK